MSGPKEPAGLPSSLVDLGRTAVMAVLNVTPDSFSDGGKFTDAALAVAHGLALAASGAEQCAGVDERVPVLPSLLTAAWLR